MINNGFFEGWYYKIVSADGKHVMAFIPGIAKGGSKSHSFVQVIGNRLKDAGYVKYPLKSFSKIKGTESVKLENNLFSTHGMKLNLSSWGLNVTGSIMFGPVHDIKRTALCPSAMGYFDYLPFMECRHEVLSMSHSLEGELSINDSCTDFTGGRGYIEKDYGHSFPKNWVWIHSNNFSEPELSLMCSVARVPLGALAITGFICILTWGDKEFRFATYTGARIKEKIITDDSVLLLLKDSKYSLSIKASLKNGAVLAAPRMGYMNRSITESLGSRVEIVLKDKDNCILLADQSDITGLEICR